MAIKIAAERPGLDMQVIEGLSYYGNSGEPYVDVLSGQDPPLSSYGSPFGGTLLEGALPPLDGLAGASAIAQAQKALSAGKAVVFADHPVDRGRVQLNATWADFDTGETLRQKKASWPAYFLTVRGSAPAQAVLPGAAFDELGVETMPLSVYLPGPIDRATQKDLTEMASAVAPQASMYVERGYQTPDENVIIQLVLAGLGAVLMLGGTLTATFLALSDARPDLATLSAVGAAPRTRRSVAAAYALVVGFVGAVLGALVGAVPGLAIARVLTITHGVVVTGSGGFSGDVPDMRGPFIDIPWLLIGGLVLGLPLLTALVVGAVSRSRLPLVARLD